MRNRRWPIIHDQRWPTILRFGSVMAIVVGAAMVVVGVVLYATAESQPDLEGNTYAPGEMIDVPRAYRSDGMVLWGTPADVDLSGVTCRADSGTRERELQVGPRDVDQDLAVHTDSAHGEVAYLASTATVFGRPRAATCEGDGLAQVFISADRDVEGSKSTARLALASAPLFVLFGMVLGGALLLRSHPR